MAKNSGAGWAPLTPADLPALCAAAALLHPGLPERPEVFAEKLRLSPEGCRKFVLDGALAGYALSHPWGDGVPPLDEFLGGLPAAPACLYIHDVALLPAARGRGAAASFTDYAAALARRLGLPRLALVSVYGTAPLWARCGFGPAPCAADLSSYGPGAVYMARRP